MSMYIARRRNPGSFKKGSSEILNRPDHIVLIDHYVGSLKKRLQVFPFRRTGVSGARTLMTRTKSDEVLGARPPPLLCLGRQAC